MGVWSSDIINGDATLECAMDFLDAAGIGPNRQRDIITICMMTIDGIGPVAVRHCATEYEEFYRCLDNITYAQAHEALEANMSTLLAMITKKGILKDNHNHLVNAVPKEKMLVPVGHAAQVLAVLLMRAGAYFPEGFKEMLDVINANDPFHSHYSNDPLRPSIMRGFMAMLDEYDVVGCCDKAPTVRHNAIGVECITVNQLVLGLSQRPMIYAMRPDKSDDEWRHDIKSEFADIKRVSLTRMRPIVPMCLALGSDDHPPSRQQYISEAMACQHAEAVKCHLQAMLTAGISACCAVDEAAIGPLTFKPVRIAGLAARADLNGRCAVAFSFDGAKGRYKLYLVGTSAKPAEWLEEPISVKPDNLQVLEDPLHAHGDDVDLTNLDGLTPKDAMLQKWVPPKIADAAQAGKEDEVVAWLDGGGNIDSTFYCYHLGVTLLIAAGDFGHLSLVDVLLQRQASVDVRDSSGASALMGAAGQGHLSIVQRLLLAGASPGLRDLEGFTALQWAELADQTECARAIKAHVKKQIEAQVAAAREAASAQEALAVLRDAIAKGELQALKDAIAAHPGTASGDDSTKAILAEACKRRAQ